MKDFLKCAFLGLITGICNGLFGSGGGSVFVPLSQKMLNLETKKSHATAIFIILPLTLISLFFYTKSGYFNFKITLLASVGGIIGGFLGAKLLKKLKSKYVKKVFGIFMIIAAVRMVIK
ncbi:MAG: sulfite exporter TauE/SafE family protein [Ruminococcaceae bacterium]|nr:sulfite exporter TauE/SafE family protein [Oscillospiraceae bacterium]